MKLKVIVTDTDGKERELENYIIQKYEGNVYIYENFRDMEDGLDLRDVKIILV